MSLEDDIKKYLISPTKCLNEHVGEHYSARRLIEQIQAKLNKLGVDDASLEAQYDNYDDPPSFCGFNLMVIVNKTENELKQEVEIRKKDEEARAKLEYQQYLKLKEKFGD